MSTLARSAISAKSLILMERAKGFAPSTPATERGNEDPSSLRGERMEELFAVNLVGADRPLSCGRKEPIGEAVGRVDPRDGASGRGG
jgi:hypothetical protein